VTGRERRRRSARARARGGHPKRAAPKAVEFNREHFRLTCRRRRGPVKLPTITLDPLVASFTWQRSGSARTGALTFNDPALRYLPGLVRQGDVVRCEIQPHAGAPWRVLWEMAVSSPNRSIQARSTTLKLRSRLKPAQQSRSHWRFREDHDHPKGWTADQITRRACQRFHVPIGPVARGKYRIRKLIDKSASVVEIVTEAWRREREWTGRRFDVSISRGLLEVIELRRPRYMLLMGPTLMDAILDESLPAGFASAVVVTSTVKRSGSKRRRKVRVKVVDRDRVRRYGYIVRHVEKHGLDTAAEARKYGKRWLARTAKPFNRATLEHPGIPWVDRGDAVRLALPQEQLSAVVFVVSASHRVDYGAYVMELVVGVKDPWTRDERSARVRRRKAEAARRRRRRTREPHARERRKPKKARVRG
jgi:hypothetical protein